jgi:hypothetical protein
VRAAFAAVLASTLVGAPLARGQSGNLTVPKKVEAGAAFSVQCGGSGKGSLYIVGPDQVIKRDVRLGETTWFPAGSLYNAGHYVVVLSSAGASDTASLDVLPKTKPADLTFIAKPSRLPVSLHDGITGTAYVFDSYKNLITTPVQVSFELTNPASPPQSQKVETRYGAARIQMNSTPHEAKDSFVARAGDVSSKRIIGQVPGDPCSLQMSAKPAGNKIEVQTQPVHDCSGNAVPDGTIVTFTEIYNDAKSTVDVPIKKGIAKVEMPAHKGATISVASGVVLGNQIRWQQ